MRGSVLALVVGTAGMAVTTAPLCAQQQPPSAGIQVITGFVADEESGAELPDAIVTIWHNGREMARVTSDEVGQYRFQGELRSGTMVFRTTAVGYLPGTQQVLVACGDIRRTPPFCEWEINLYLQSIDDMFKPSDSECTVTGTIYHGWTGAVLPSALVQLEDHGFTAGTDENGNFTVHRVETGVRLLTVKAIGMVSHERMVLVSCADGEDVTRARFQLFPSWIW